MAAQRDTLQQGASHRFTVSFQRTLNAQCSLSGANQCSRCTDGEQAADPVLRLRCVQNRVHPSAVT